MGTVQLAYALVIGIVIYLVMKLVSFNRILIVLDVYRLLLLLYWTTIILIIIGYICESEF